jgi:hypothetical protein
MKHATEFYLRVQQEEFRATRLKAHTSILIAQKNKQFKGTKKGTSILKGATFCQQSLTKSYLCQLAI